MKMRQGEQKTAELRENELRWKRRQVYKAKRVKADQVEREE